MKKIIAFLSSTITFCAIGLSQNGTVYVGNYGATPVGTNTQIPFNNNGIMTGNSSLTFNANQEFLCVGGLCNQLAPGNYLSMQDNEWNTTLQMNLENMNTGNNASGDLVVTLNDGTNSVGYLDLGANNSGYLQPAYNTGAGNDGYLLMSGPTTGSGNFSEATTQQNTAISWDIGGTTLQQQIMQLSNPSNNAPNLTIQNPLPVIGSTLTLTSATQEPTTSATITGCSVTFTGTYGTAGGTVTVSGCTFSASLAAGMAIQVSGDVVNPSNNGIFILSAASISSITYYNAYGVTETPGVAITGFTGTGPGTLTFTNTGINSLSAGSLYTFSGFTGGAANLNGTSGTILAGSTPTTFQVTTAVTTTGSSAGYIAVPTVTTSNTWTTDAGTITGGGIITSGCATYAYQSCLPYGGYAGIPAVTVAGFTTCTGNNGTTFPVIASSTNNLVIVNASGTTCSTGSPTVQSTAVVNSPTLSFTAPYGTGTGTQGIDKWNCQDVIGSVATNPTSTLTCSHTGTTGASAFSAPAYYTATNCAINSVSPGACGSASAGAFVIPTTTTTYTVNTTAVTAHSRIMLTPITFASDLPSSPTCVAPVITAPWSVSGIVAGTSFTVTLTPTTGQTCFMYEIKD